MAAWLSLDDTPFFRALHSVAERRVGSIVDRRHSFGDRDALQRLIADAGFHEVQVETVSRTIRFADPAVFIRLNTMALVGMSAKSSELTDDDRARHTNAIIEDSGAVQAAYSDAQGLSFEIGANIVTARA